MLILSSVQNYVFDSTFHMSPLPEHLRNCMHSFKPYPSPSPHAHTQWRQTGTFRNLVSKHTTPAFSSEMGNDSNGSCARGKRVSVVFMWVWLCACGYKGRLLNAGFGPRANRKSFITRSKSYLNGNTGVNTLLNVCGNVCLRRGGGLFNPKGRVI